MGIGLIYEGNPKIMMKILCKSQISIKIIEWEVLTSMLGFVQLFLWEWGLSWWWFPFTRDGSVHFSLYSLLKCSIFT
jgi:hypothetical protein